MTLDFLHFKFINISSRLTNKRNVEIMILSFPSPHQYQMPKRNGQWTIRHDKLEEWMKFKDDDDGELLNSD